MLENGTKKLQAKDRRFASLYARMLLNGNVDWKRLGNVYRPDDKHPVWKAKQVIKRKEIQQLTSEEINKIYESARVTRETVVNEEKRILEDARASNNLRIQLDVVNNWRESMDFKQTKQVTTREHTNYLELIDRDKGKLKAKQTRKLTETAGFEADQQDKQQEEQQ